MIPLNKIKRTVALLLIALLHGISGHAQKYCIQVTMEFKDADAPEAQKAATMEVLNKRLKIQKLQADIKLEKDMIIAKMPCDNYENYSKNFFHDKFEICETYEAGELNNAMDAIGLIADSLADNAPEIAKGYTAYTTPFEKLLDRNFEGGPVIGVCPIAYEEEFMKLAALPEIKKVLPADLAFVFGFPEKDALAVPVYAVKKNNDKTAPVTIGMLKETTVTRSYDKIHYNVDLEFKNEYKAAWAALTKKNTQKFLAIMLGNTVLSCPMVMAPIENGKASIAGNMGREEAAAIAQRINLSLPLEVLITEVKTID